MIQRQAAVFPLALLCSFTGKADFALSEANMTNSTEFEIFWFKLIAL